MIIVQFFESIKKLFHQQKEAREDKTRKYTRKVIKKYSKTLRKLSYE